MRLPLALFVLALNGCSFATTPTASASDWPKTTCSLPSGPQRPECNQAPDSCSVTCEPGTTHAVCTPAGPVDGTSTHIQCNNRCECTY